LRVSELFGLRPLGPTWEQAKLVFLGDPKLPKSRFGFSSLGMATPRLSIQTWRGRRVMPRTVPILNLFNRTPTPYEDGWSVRITQVEDFRGRTLTYDSHNGTDFVVPPGTPVVAAAAGRVVARRQEWNRGGLKLYVDHGDGLLSTYNHLGRTLRRVGEAVRRGDVIALSAYSGADGFLTFPWVAPHVHFNVLFGGVQVDPFARAGETSLFRREDDPRPFNGEPEDSRRHTSFDSDRVQALLDDLDGPEHRSRFESIEDVTLRGFELLIESCTFPTRFRTREAGRLLYEAACPREPRLDLPFQANDWDATAFCDDLGFR
jgi:murein DD-endopeptidase